MQRNIEILVGKLATDEEFRRAFRSDALATLQHASEWGLTLTDVEIRALVSTDCGLWDRIADEIDVRLQKASFKNA